MEISWRASRVWVAQLLEEWQKRLACSTALFTLQQLLYQGPCQRLAWKIQARLIFSSQACNSGGAYLAFSFFLAPNGKLTGPTWQVANLNEEATRGDPDFDDGNSLSFSLFVLYLNGAVRASPARFR